jgi:TRAP transporter TAXI family solute receptor
MARTTRQRVIVALAALALTIAASGVWAARAFVTIGTGNVTGVYYRAGGGVCQFVNAGRADHQIRCTVASTPGSVDNINALRRGERDFGFAQADLAQQAYAGSATFADNDRFDGLRSVFALHSETVTVIAGPGTGIASAQDLRGQRVNIGTEGSGQRASMTALMNALGWTRNDFSEATEMGASAQVGALCDGDIDAAVFITGHPHGGVKRGLDCGGQLVDVSGPAINRLVRDAGYYSSTVIPPDAYSDLSREIQTYGVTALLLSSTNTPRATVREITAAVFQNASAFTGWHRALSGLSEAGMARGTDAIAAPRHPGAQLYFEDNDLL